MGKVTGFMEAPRETPTRRPVEERVNDYLEVYQDFPEQKLRTQAARCMDCSVPVIGDRTRPVSGVPARQFRSALEPTRV